MEAAWPWGPSGTKARLTVDGAACNQLHRRNASGQRLIAMQAGRKTSVAGGRLHRAPCRIVQFGQQGIADRPRVGAEREGSLVSLYPRPQSVFPATHEEHV